MRLARSRMRSGTLRGSSDVIRGWITLGKRRIGSSRILGTADIKAERLGGQFAKPGCILNRILGTWGVSRAVHPSEGGGLGWRQASR